MLTAFLAWWLSLSLGRTVTANSYYSQEGCKWSVRRPWHAILIGGVNEDCCLDGMYIWSKFVICRQVIVSSSLCFSCPSSLIDGLVHRLRLIMHIRHNCVLEHIPSYPLQYFFLVHLYHHRQTEDSWNTSHSMRWHSSEFFELSSLPASSRFAKVKKNGTTKDQKCFAMFNNSF